MRLIGFLIVGIIAGWLAGKITKGKGFGLLGNLGVGITGAFVGGFLFGLIGFTAHGFIGSLIASTVGAVFLIWIVGLIKKS